MSKPCCPECKKFRKGEFCQQCYEEKKQELEATKVAHAQESKFAAEAHRDLMRQILDSINNVVANTPYTEIIPKIQKHIESIKQQLHL